MHFKETIKDLMPSILLILLSVYMAITLVKEPTVMAEEDVSMDVTEVIEATWEPIPDETETLQICTETETETEAETETETETETEEFEMPYTEEEIDLIAHIVASEAGNQCELGQRLVIDCVLNRVSSQYFPNSVTDVIFQKNPTQFAVTTNGRLYKFKPSENIYRLVYEEVRERTNDRVIYFTAGRYNPSGDPYMKVQDHYFSYIRKSLQ